MKETDITPLFHTRWCFLLLILIAAGGTVFAFLTGSVEPVATDGGFIFPAAGTWIADRRLSMWAGVALSVLSAVFIGYINKGFNVIRHITWLFAGFYVFMLGAFPSVMGQLYGGNVMCAAVLLAIIPLFSSFQNPKATREIFLAFFILSLGSLTCVSEIGIMALFAVGCVQMQCLKFKGILAMLVGIAVPYWLAFGSGAPEPAGILMPEFTGIFQSVPTGKSLAMLAYGLLTMSLGALAGILNLVKVYSYNARTRAYNGFFLVLFLGSCILALADYGRFAVYLPLVCMGSAFQLGHFFVINSHRRAYIPMLVIIAMYIATYWWAILA